MPVFSWGSESLTIYTVAFRLPVTLWAFYALIVCFIKRLNDLGASRLWVLLLLVPPLNGLFFLYLLFARPPNCLLLRLERSLFRQG